MYLAYRVPKLVFVKREIVKKATGKGLEWDGWITQGEEMYNKYWMKEKGGGGIDNSGAPWFATWHKIHRMVETKTKMWQIIIYPV